MPERDKPNALTRAIQKAISSPEGLRIPITEGNEVAFRVTGTEIVLFARPRASNHAEAMDGSMAVQSVPPRARERESKRVSVSGNVASAPQYAPLARRGLRAGFILAEHLEDGATRFHHVYATGDYARRIQAKDPIKGDRVTVEGERQRNQRLEKGVRKEVEELYCYGLRIADRSPQNRPAADQPSTASESPIPSPASGRPSPSAARDGFKGGPRRHVHAD